MTRPSAPVLLEREFDSLGYAKHKIEILGSEGFWILEYQNKPCALRTEYATGEGYKFKYPRTGFNNLAHCQRLADQLNEEFETVDFSVRRLV